MRRTWIVGLALAGVTGLLLTAGCGSKVTEANAEKIEEGMTVEEVIDILGEPTSQTGAEIKVGDADLGGGVYTWRDDDARIDVTFAQGKVTTVSYVLLEDEF